MRRLTGPIGLLVALSGGIALTPTPPGLAGGTVTIAQTSEPKTFNPVIANDQPTRDVLSAMFADLVHINRRTLDPELALASRCETATDGLRYTVTLRDGLRFSDGSPLTADDVVFTFEVYEDPRVNAPQRDLLVMDGKPITVVKIAPMVVRFDLPAPYGPGIRLFDSFWILPKHALEQAYRDGQAARAWTLGSPPDEIVTSGPFRLKQYVPGQRVVLERNPYYWKRDEAGRPLPYLDRLEIAFVADQNAQLLRLMTHEVSAAGRLRPDDGPQLERTPFLNLRDAGAGFEYNVLFFNWQAAPPSGEWFRSLPFRQAVACAIDRDAIVRLAYAGRASPLSSQVTPGNARWRTETVTNYPYDPARAGKLLRDAGFRRDDSGALVDRDGRPVGFSLMVSASNQPRRKMATLIQEDLARIGLRVQVVPTDFGTLVDAVLKTRRFDAALWGIASGDADPNSEMNVWTSGGTLHVWNMLATPGARPLEPWEQEVDRLMNAQMTATTFAERKTDYDRVQQLVTAHVPMIFLASPHVLAAAARDLGNFDPAALDPVLLWNVERWFLKRPAS